MLGERSKNSNKLATKQSRPKRKHAEENHKQQQPIRKVIKLYGRVLKKDNKRLSFIGIIVITTRLDDWHYPKCAFEY